MALLDDRVRQQLRERFAGRLSGRVTLTLHTRPGTGRLILPSGLGCATCDDARELAEELAAAAPDHLQLEVVDVSQVTDGGRPVPTLFVTPDAQEPRIAWQGFPGGYEFATVVDAIERASTGEHGLSEETVTSLDRLSEPVEVMVFATPG